MATFEEIMQAAVNADNAGDANAARTLVQLAQSMKGGPVQKERGPNDPVSPPSPDTTDGIFVETAPGVKQFRANPKDVVPEKNVFGDTAAEMAAEPWAAAGQFAQGVTNPRESAIYKAMPENWNTALKGVYAGAANAGLAALTGVGAGLSYGAGAVADVVAGDRTQERKLAGDLMMAMQVASPELAGVSSVGSSAGRAASAAMKAEAKIASPAGAAADIGILPSLGMTGKTGAMVAAGLEKIPGVGSVIAKDAMRAVGEVERAFRSATQGGVSSASAGGVLQSGLKGFVTKFKARSDTLFDNVATHIPPGTRLQLQNTQKFVDETKQYFSQNPELAKKLGLNNWDAILSEAKKNGVAWRAVRQLRTQIGEAIGTNRGSLVDEDVDRLKGLYGALTEDMSATAKAAGPQAFKAWSRANGFYKAGSQRIERSLDATISADRPERAFEAFDAITKADKASSDLKRMRQIKSSMPEEGWKTVASSIAERMGKAKPGAQNAEGSVFSPSAFLTEWNKMDRQAKNILFDEATRIELEKIAKVAEAVKAGNLERNSSNTGTAIAVSGLATAMFNAPISTTGALAGTYLGAKWVTSPLFLRAVNSALKGDTRAIAAIANGKSSLAQDARILLQMSAVEAQGGDAANSTTPPRAAISR